MGDAPRLTGSDAAEALGLSPPWVGMIPAWTLRGRMDLSGQVRWGRPPACVLRDSTIAMEMRCLFTLAGSSSLAVQWP